jgi:hypothetical protein
MLSATTFAKAQWQPTTGPFMASNYIGMDVNQIVVGGERICAIINNQVYLSYTNGASWMLASGGLNYVKCIAYSDSTIYAGTPGSGIYLSTNNGSSYKAINNNLPAKAVIDVLLLSGNMVLAEVSTYETPYFRDLYYSTDKGNTWILTNGLTNKYVKCLASVGTDVYAGTSFGIYKSSDNGLSWNLSGLPNTEITSIAVKGNSIFAAENNSNGGLYLSADQGTSWNKLNSGLPNSFVGALAIGDNYVYAGLYWEGVYRSADNGASWALMTNGFTYSKDITSLAVKGSNVFAGSNDGCAVSNNEGGSWYCGPRTYDLSIRSIATSGENVISATSYMMYKSADKGSNWETFQISMNALTANDSVVYAGGNGGMTISRDGGTHWKWMDIFGLPDSPGFTAIAANDSVTFASTSGKGIYYSKDAGHNWVERNMGLNDLTVNTLALADTVLFAGTNSEGVFVSHDSGLHWSAAGTGIPDTCIQSLAAYNNIVYAGTLNQGIYKSTDLGATWQHLTNGITGTDIQCLYTCGVNVFAGIKGEGFFMSPDNGNSWAAHNTGLMGYNVRTISENGSDIYAGTTGAGIWRRNLSELPLTLSVKKVKISDPTLCEGYSSTIQVDVIGGKPPYNYTWDNGSHTSTLTVTPASTTTYHFTVTDSKSGTATADVTIKVRPKPETPVITRSGDTLISSAPEGNIWMFHDQVLYYEHSNKLLPNMEGSYSVMVMRDGCISDTSNKFPVGIGESQAQKNMAVYPNPATNMITVEILSAEKDLLLTIYDTKGNEILKRELTETKTPIDIGELNGGIYYMKLMNDRTVEVKLLIIE